MKRKWQTLLDTPLSREVIDRCGYLVDRANTKSKVWKEVALEWVAKGSELTEDLNENSRLMEGVGGRCDRIQKLHECQLSEREETKELHKESRRLLVTSSQRAGKWRARCATSSHQNHHATSWGSR